ncbi:hypothetical protein CPX_001354 [Candidatus Phytoplasma pruni]|uniref:Uncharacterized protein n=1 Tax=Candidatus Phytoplasma pruni TaxID=479893 RepID=A0A0M1N0H0_9MOLU|nr:hypothetical protein [Candidatus Phytoplasma pruni]KOR75652.1 hypothetical protein CPX_001354 [Candidatus Phytoplasma pruni]MDW3617862.1 hypothetical protein [Candidatus Phytoplasma pruni]
MFYQTPRKLPPKNNIGTHEKYENKDDYDNDLKEWKKQYYIKQGEYKGREIRKKLYRESQTLYNSEGNKHQYKYKKGFINDEWFLDNINLGTSMVLKDFQWKLDYLDTTPPPAISEKMTFSNETYRPPI